MTTFARRRSLPAFWVLLASFSASLAFAQDSKMELFEGGDIRTVFGMRSNLFTGAGVRGAYGGMVAPVNPEPFVIFGNPAALGRIVGRKVIVASSPTIEFDIATLTDMNPTIKEEVDARLESFQITSPPIYPKMEGTIGRTGSLISGFALSLPVLADDDDRWFDGRLPRLFDIIAFGYTQPLTLHTNFTYSGLRTRLRTIEDSPENEILLYASIKMDADMLLTSDSWNVSVAREMGDLWLGAGAQRTASRIEIHSNQRTDGIMSKAGSESSFNDPQSPWDDDYYFGAHGSFDGSSLALRLGALYQPTERFFMGATARIQGGMEMDADFDLQLHTFRPLKLTAGPGEKRFDVNQIEDASELTRTTTKIFETANTMAVSIPSEVSFAATYIGFMKPTMTFTKYFGELSYEYLVVEDGSPHNYKRGFKPDWAFNFGLDFSLFSLAVGGIQTADMVGGYKDINGNPIPPATAILIPRLALGFDTALSNQLTLGVLLSGLPEDALRFTLEYSL